MGTASIWGIYAWPTFCQVIFGGELMHTRRQRLSLKNGWEYTMIVLSVIVCQNPKYVEITDRLRVAGKNRCPQNVCYRANM